SRRGSGCTRAPRARARDRALSRHREDVAPRHRPAYPRLLFAIDLQGALGAGAGALPGKVLLPGGNIDVPGQNIAVFVVELEDIRRGGETARVALALLAEDADFHGIPAQVQSRI